MKKVKFPLILTHSQTNKTVEFFPRLCVDIMKPEIFQISKIKKTCEGTYISHTMLAPSPLYMDRSGTIYSNPDNLDLHQVKTKIGEYSIVFAFPNGYDQQINKIATKFNINKI